MGVVQTAIGVVIGALVTVLASRYYFRRSISKRLSLYGLLNSFVFDGIARDVRKQLQFRFQGREVNELQQVVFLVANDGERAIRDVIESLTLTIPPGVEVLDASIVHRQPEGLKVDIIPNLHPRTGSSFALDFPLLNKGEFFVVKLLLSGRFKLSHLTVLCDDLPRSIQIESLPPNSFQDTEYKFEWVPAVIGLGVLLVPAWACYSAYMLHEFRPALFHPFVFRPGAVDIHPEALVFLALGAAIFLLFLIVGFGLLGVAIFGGDFPPSRGPRFRLPKELQGLAFPYRALHIQSDLEEVRGKKVPEEHPSVAPRAD